MAEPHQLPETTPGWANLAYFHHLQNVRSTPHGPESSNSMATQPEFSLGRGLLRRTLGFTSYVDWSARQYAGMAEMRERLGSDAPPLAIGVSTLPNGEYRPEPHANVPIPYTNPNLPPIGMLQANDPSILARARYNEAIGHTSHLVHTGQSYVSPYVENGNNPINPINDLI